MIAFARALARRRARARLRRQPVPVARTGYRLGLPRSGRWREALNTDSAFYGGSDVGNRGGVAAEPIPWHDQAFSAAVTLPPLAAVWLVPDE